MAQWWEHSPSTNVARVRFPVLVSYVGWVCCWLSSLLRGFFSGYSSFPPSIKTNISKFQLDLDVKCLLMSPWLGRLGDFSPHYDVKFDLQVTFFFFYIIYLLKRAVKNIELRVRICMHKSCMELGGNFTINASIPHFSSPHFWKWKSLIVRDCRINNDSQRYTDELE